MKKRSAQEQKLADDARLLRAWKKWHRDELKEALNGLHAPMLERLAFILKELTPESAPLLLAYIRGIDWSAIEYQTRLTALHEVNAAVTALRESTGQSPFDDGFPGDRDNVFRTIKSIVAP